MSADAELENLIKRLEQRVTTLELHATHWQRDFETLNQVVLEQGRKLDQMGELLTRLTSQVNLVRGRTAEAPEEKPPHY